MLVHQRVSIPCFGSKHHSFFAHIKRFLLFQLTKKKDAFMGSTILPRSGIEQDDSHPFTWSFLLLKHRSNELCVPPSKATFDLGSKSISTGQISMFGTSQNDTGIEKTNCVQLNECWLLHHIVNKKEKTTTFQHISTQHPIFEPYVPSGNLLHSYWTWPMKIVEFSIKHGDFP